MPLSIQEAQEIANAVAAEFDMPAPPPIYVTNDLNKMYAGAYFDHQDNLEHIEIAPKYFSDRTIAHEIGHWIYHMYNPGVCKGGSQECEEVARMIEAYWVDKQKQEGKLKEDWK